jgi:cysteine synthase
MLKNYPRVYENNAESIGRTPLVKLNALAGSENATILAKIEGRNPAYSVKCRIGAALLWDARDRGELRPGRAIVEATSGNTGIALAFASAAMNVPCVLTMPDTMSVERRKVLAILGAKLILTPGSAGMKGAIELSEQMAAEQPDKYFLAKQFENPANPAIHEKTTAVEIFEDTGRQVDALVCGVGTGGTLTGIGRYFKRIRQQSLHCVAVEPVHSPVITQTLQSQALQPGPHKIQGIGAGFVPKNLDLTIVDQVELVDQDEAMATARFLAKREGILCGVSCGAAALAASRLAQRPEWKGKTIVVVLPDAAERYLSGPLFDGLFKADGTAIES